MDEFRIFNRKLTNAEATAVKDFQLSGNIYTSVLPVACSGSCSAGQTVRCDNSGTLVCCSAGQFFREGTDSTCQSCPVGTYSLNGAQTSCTACAGGTYRATTGGSSASDCTSCSTGLWSAPGSSSASACVGCVPLGGSAISAGGGTPTTDVAGYYVHSFTSTGATTVTFGRDVVADVLLVGGGGGGGNNCGGGGGAGAVLYYSGYKFSSGTYSFTVGSGGNAQSTLQTQGNSGGDSKIVLGTTDFFVAKGGGGGAAGAISSDVTKGLTGGSGGGGGTEHTASLSATGRCAAGAASNSNSLSTIVGYTLGFAGGAGQISGGGGSDYDKQNSGGGGGAGEAGLPSTNSGPGRGGNGIHQVSWGGSTYSLDSLFGSAYSSVAQIKNGKFYIAGGGGGGGSHVAAGCASVTGGLGGGGLGSDCDSTTPVASAGVTSTGSGGGGGGGSASTRTGAAGGSGLILLRYSTCQNCSAGTRLANAGASGVCQPCNTGSYSANGASLCTTCLAGYMQPSLGVISPVLTGGGLVYTDVAGYYVHSFPGNLAGQAYTVTFARDTVADVFLVGGGGSGGINIGGGGGAGAVVFYSGYKFAQGTTYVITVGAGGLEASGTGTPTAGYGNAGNPGSDSTIKIGTSNIFSAAGGGSGGAGGGGTCASIAVTNGVSGGSGGGAGGCSAGSNSPGLASSANAMSSIAGYTVGKNGGANFVSGTTTNIAAGGGGGAGVAGTAAASAVPGTGGNGVYQVGWAGANLVLATIFGSAYTSVADLKLGNYYIGGGGGGGGWGSTDAYVSGGYGGSGQGVIGTGSTGPTAALANTGSGGGGGSVGGTKKGGAGGSGLILLRYSLCQACGAGSVAGSAGASACSACGSGTYGGPGASTCLSCPADSSSSLGSDRCYANAGKYPLHTLDAYATADSSVTVTGKVFVFNNDRNTIAESFWGLSGTVYVDIDPYLNLAAVIAAPQIPPAISDNDYPIVTDGAGAVVKPYVWYKFDTGACTTDSGTSQTTLGTNSAPSSTGTQATCPSTVWKRGSSAADFVASLKRNFRITTSEAQTWALDTASAAGGTGVTIAFWGLMKTSSQSYGRFFSFSTGGTVGGSLDRNFELERNALTNDILFVQVVSPTSVSWVLSGYVDNLWHHYVWSVAAGGTWRIWIDGTQVVGTAGEGFTAANQKAAVIPAPASGHSRFYNWGVREDGTELLDGNMDDFRIHKAVLTTAQVTTLYQGRVGVYTASFGNCPDTTTCASGSKHCDKDGTTKCCAAGQFLRDGVDSACQSCPAGTFSTNGAGTSCASCAPNTWSAGGASACTPCGGGGVQCALIQENGVGSLSATAIAGTSKGFFRFTSTTGTNTVMFARDTRVRVLVVGGGGGGTRRAASGGGAGAMIQGSMLLKAGTIYTITIGAGGAGWPPVTTGTQAPGNAGFDSSIAFGSPITNEFLAKGGGGGGSNLNNGNINAGSGGSGGGGAASATSGSRAAGSAVSTNVPSRVYGNNGGAGNDPGANSCGSTDKCWCAGGGGGANTAGAEAAPGSSSTGCTGGVGGNGISDDITGTSTIYAAGGGAGAGNGGTAGNGGSSNVGGAGASGSNAASNGAANTGSGGGGSGFTGSNDGASGAGGDGVIILQWSCPPGYAGSVTSCTQCPAGTVTGGAVDTCLSCPAGKEPVDVSDLPTGAETSYATSTDVYAVYTFTSVGSSTITFPKSVTADILLVGGGGAGSTGGGGGGEVKTVTGVTLSGTQTITVGAGGIAGSSVDTMGGNGGASSIAGSLSQTALGGGGGATTSGGTPTYGSNNVWAMGGMGCDQTSRPVAMTGKVQCSLPSQAVGTCLGGVSNRLGCGGGGGGSGSATVGTNGYIPASGGVAGACSGFNIACGGKGGDGIANSYRTGTAQTYGGGGGGGTNHNADVASGCTAVDSAGGLGGGGAGQPRMSIPAVPGTANSGGGGGGANIYEIFAGSARSRQTEFAAGGSGLVVIRVSLCKTCSAGNISSSGSMCTTCPAGTWPNPGKTACASCGTTTTCASGTFARCTSSTTNVCCGTNQFFIEGVTDTCVDCPANRYSDGSSTFCVDQCPAGQYKDNSVCLGCPVGMFSASPST